MKKTVTVDWSEVIHVKAEIEIPLDMEDRDEILAFARMNKPTVYESQVQHDSIKIEEPNEDQ